MIIKSIGCTNIDIFLYLISILCNWSVEWKNQMVRWYERYIFVFLWISVEDICPKKCPDVAATYESVLQILGRAQLSSTTRHTTRTWVSILHLLCRNKGTQSFAVFFLGNKINCLCSILRSWVYVFIISGK